MFIEFALIALADIAIASMAISISYLTYRAAVFDKKFLRVSFGFIFFASGVSIEALIFSMILAFLVAQGGEISPFVYKYEPFWFVSSLLISVGLFLILSYYIGGRYLSLPVLLPIKVLIDIISFAQSIGVSALSLKQSKYSSFAYALLGLSQILTSIAYLYAEVTFLFLSTALKFISFAIILTILIRA